MYVYMYTYIYMSLQFVIYINVGMYIYIYIYIYLHLHTFVEGLGFRILGPQSGLWVGGSRSLRAGTCLQLRCPQKMLAISFGIRTWTSNVYVRVYIYMIHILYVYTYTCMRVCIYMYVLAVVEVTRHGNHHIHFPGGRDLDYA